MTQDRIIEMAKQAGFHFHDAGYGPEVLHTEPHEYSQKCFERFAALVRAEVLEEAAKVCDARATKNELACNDAVEDEATSLRSAAWQISVCASAIRALKGQP